LLIVDIVLYTAQFVVGTILQIGPTLAENIRNQTTPFVFYNPNTVLFPRGFKFQVHPLVEAGVEMECNMETGYKAISPPLDQRRSPWGSVTVISPRRIV
jgi:F420-0:gamma-glutamyl ligase-like protein